MGIEGIGARIARKEDKRFITGHGRYVDDINRPGQAHAAPTRQAPPSRLAGIAAG